MTSIQITVPETTAQRFRSLSEQQQSLVSQLLVDCLADHATLTDLMDYMSFKVTQRGLTLDIAKRLLDEE